LSGAFAVMLVYCHATIAAAVAAVRYGAPTMAIFPLRVLGLFLLTLAIAIPSCQAVFPPDGEGTSEPFRPGLVRD
jgi:hypothetical protein